MPRFQKTGFGLYLIFSPKAISKKEYPDFLKEGAA